VRLRLLTGLIAVGSLAVVPVAGAMPALVTAGATATPDADAAADAPADAPAVARARPDGTGKPDKDPKPDKPGKGKPNQDPTEDPTEAATEDPVGGGGDPADARVVVAVVDDPTNPYHDFFHAPERTTAVTPAVLAELGVDGDHTISLTRTGDFAADYAADQAQFAAVRPGELYWFEGTNVFSITFDPGAIPLLPESAESHGVGTSAAVLAANPEAIVVLVEGVTAESETWAFTTPFVDIVSTSYGFPGSLPIPFHLENGYTGVVGHGKLHVGAADNSPALSPPDGTSGPWWSIGVAGFHEDTSEGRELLSGTLPDVVSDFGQELPYCGQCESGTEMVYGTSFATPRTAGTISKILLEARRAAGHVGGIVTEGVAAPTMVAGDLNGAPIAVTNWRVRRALEEAAYYPALDEYDVVEGVFDLTVAPVNPVAPYLQVGWGVVSVDEHGVVEQALAQLGVGDAEVTTKGADACQFMTANVQARHLYWDYVAIGSESWLTTDEDPYLYC
jgi:hypothetical protein